ncbi:MAG: response regulator [Aggregatilineales bacterium]
MLAEAHPISPPSSEASMRPRILVVDDDPTNRKLLHRIFKEDYEVIAVEGGQQALELLECEPFHLVLLDVMMPVMTGFDVLTILRERAWLDDLPVIMISARDNNTDVVQGFRLGARDYITKPINVDVVRARVQTHIALKLLADEHKRTIEQLQLTQTMQDNFYRIVSHDLKGPLTNLRMAQFVLRDLIGEQAEALSILDNVDLMIDEMNDMIRVFLDALAARPGQITTKIGTISVADVLQNVSEQYALTAASKSISLRVAPTDQKVRADARLLSQILSNLISNAIKYSPVGSETKVYVERSGTAARIAVADEGPGVPVEERGGLFQMFSKLSPRPTGSETSTGLGLWVVRQLAEAQGGCVGVDFPAGGGSVFWVELPAV